MRRELKYWLKEHTLAGKEETLEPIMTIGEASSATELSESAIRKYEAAGLIRFHRSNSNVRVISLEDLERIRVIHGLIREEGLNLEGIRRLWSLLPCWEIKGNPQEICRECEVMRGVNMPCWMCPDKPVQCHDANERDPCRVCDVYRCGTYCMDDLKFLVHEQIKQPYSTLLPD